MLTVTADGTSPKLVPLNVKFTPPAAGNDAGVNEELNVGARYENVTAPVDG
jgi:hypothetical protein